MRAAPEYRFYIQVEEGAKILSHPVWKADMNIDYQVEDGGKYDNSLFGLTYSTVGQDIRKDDLFENIESVPENTPLPEPVGTAEPPATIPPAQSSEIIPEISPESTTAPVPVREEGGSMVGPMIAIAAAVIAAGVSVGVALNMRKRRRRKRRRVRR